MIEERTVNILKRLSYDYFNVALIDNSYMPKGIMVTIQNRITLDVYQVFLSQTLLYGLYNNQRLKYSYLHSYLLNQMFDDKSDEWMETI